MSFDYYEKVPADYVPDIVAGAYRVFKSRTELIGIIRLPKENAEKKKLEPTAIYFSNRSIDQMPVPVDQNRELYLALRIMMMMTRSLEARSVDTLEACLQPVTLAHSMSWPKFASNVYLMLALHVGD